MRLFLVGFFSLFLLCASPAVADYRELYRDGKYSEALQELEKSPEALQRSYAYYLNRGLIHHALNQDALAVGYFSKARALDPSAEEVLAPLNDATANLVKWLGVSRLDATSYLFESLGESLPLDIFLAVFGALSLLSWLGFFFIQKRRGFFIKLGFGTLICALLFGAWGAWLDQHPLVILTESRLVKSGPGENFLDRGAVEVGMKLRVVGQMDEASGESPGKSRRWWKVRFNDKHDLGFIPDSSGLLLTDESNKPEA